MREMDVPFNRDKTLILRLEFFSEGLKPSAPLTARMDMMTFVFSDQSVVQKYLKVQVNVKYE